jgi:outer membrane receptor protein involved in Fe transport
MQTTSSWLNRLNFRTTYGFNGNVDKNTAQKTLVSVSTTPSPITGETTGYVSSFGNPFLRWEKTATVNTGIDFSVLGNLFFGSIDVYSKQGEDILGNIALPAITGTTGQRMNSAKVSNKGIELGIGVHTSLANTGITLDAKANYAYNKNEITALYYPSPSSQSILTGGYVEGYPAQSIWAWNYLGMTDGIPYVQTGNGSEQHINSVTTPEGNPLEFLCFEGPAVAPHTTTVSGSISGYGLDFSFLIIGDFGGHFRNPAFNYPAMTQNKDIVNRFIAEVYDGSPDVPAWPAQGNTSLYNWGSYVSNFNTLVESSSFIKLKEISLTYIFPKRRLNAIGIKELKLYTQVRNLGCLWTANSKGYDPEWLPGTLKPSTTYAFGLNLNF